MSKWFTLAALVGAAMLSCVPAHAQSLFTFFPPPPFAPPNFRPPSFPAPAGTTPRDVAPVPDDESDSTPVDPRLNRQIVSYAGNEAVGTISVDTPHTYLY